MMLKPLAAFALLLLSTLVLAPAACGAEPAHAPRPNVILVLVDDAGFADFPFLGKDLSWTPHIDQLAREGIRFTRFYTNAPICSPSRAALVTGRFPARVGIISFLASRRENEVRRMPNWLDPATPTLARALQSAGYATGHFGKWHLGGGRDDGDAPLISDYGFDESLTQFEGLGDRVLPLMPGRRGKPRVKLPLGAASQKLERGEVRWKNREEITSAFVASTVEFIRAAELAGKPFYVNVWPDDVHTPLVPPRGEPQKATQRERYVAVLKNMDAQLSELFDYVRKDPKLRDNTLIIVTSDNGPEPGAGSAGKLRGAKGQLFEGGIREPLVVWGPGLVDAPAAGETNDTSVLTSVDLVASLLQLAGAESPKGIDGEDLSATLLGKRRDTRQAPLFWVAPPDRRGSPQENMPAVAVREGQWKLLLDGDGQGVRLYDVDADPLEAVDVSVQHSEIVARLRKLALEWSRQLPTNPLDHKLLQ
jgi:uncharacterized sulfatase